MSDHATVQVGSYSIPLIGIPVGATCEMCDLCGEVFPIRDIEFNGVQFLCPKCRYDESEQYDTR